MLIMQKQLQNKAFFKNGLPAPNLVLKMMTSTSVTNSFHPSPLHACSKFWVSA